MSKKKAPTVTPQKDLQLMFKAFKRAIQRSHSWQQQVNSELRERLGELEARMEEVLPCDQASSDNSTTPSKKYATSSISPPNSRTALAS